MAKEKPAEIKVKTFATHKVITQPNPLRKVLRRVDERDLDDPVARAEAALAGLSGEFKDWNPQKRVEAWRETHNVWLQVASELGIFGFAVFAVLVSQAFFAG